MKKILNIIPIVLLIIYAYLILLIPYYQNAKLYSMEHGMAEIHILPRSL